MTNLPKITRTENNAIGYECFRVEGGDLAPEWAARLRPGRTAYCVITIWERGATVGCFGGEVWPGAWPAIFTCSKGTVQGGPRVDITSMGLDLFAKARMEAAPFPSPLNAAVKG